MTASGAVTLLVVRLSDSFSDFWPALARDLGVPLVEWTAAEPGPPPAGAGVVLVAAGGQEADVATLLPRLAVPGGVPVIAVGSAASHRLAAQIVGAGAADYFALPEDRDGLRDALTAAVQRCRATLGRAALAQLEAQAHAFRDIVGESPSLKAVLERAARVVPHGDATILITGETGTGKELLARALHYGGPRAAAPFAGVAHYSCPDASAAGEPGIACGPPRSWLITAHTDSSRDTGSRRLVRGGAGCMMLVEVRDHAAGS